MEIQVLYFASLKDRVGRGEERVSVPDGTDLQSLAQLLVERHAPLAGALGHVRFAVNREFAAPDTRLRGGDEVALIPPMSGGAA